MNLEEVEDELEKVYGEEMIGRSDELYNRRKEIKGKRYKRGGRGRTTIK